MTAEQAAVILRDSIRLPNEKLFVYGGGIAEWATNGFPIELGSRNSGQLTESGPDRRKRQTWGYRSNDHRAVIRPATPPGHR